MTLRARGGDSCALGGVVLLLAKRQPCGSDQAVVGDWGCRKPYLRAVSMHVATTMTPLMVGQAVTESAARDWSSGQLRISASAPARDELAA